MADSPFPALTFDLLPPDADAAAAELFLRALPGVSDVGAAGFVAALRNDPDMTIVAAMEGGKPIAISVLRKVGVTTELLLVATDPDGDPTRQLDLAAVRDAGDRVGRRPLTVETNAQSLEWYTSLGFKLVGKKKRPDGTWTYRLGWHGARPSGPTAALKPEPCPDPAELLAGTKSRS